MDINIDCVNEILSVRKDVGHLNSLYDLSLLNIPFERAEVERTCKYLKSCGFLIIMQTTSGGFAITITEKGLKYLDSIS